MKCVSLEEAKKNKDIIAYVSEHEEKRDDIMKKLCEYYEMGDISYTTAMRKIVYHKFCHTGLNNPIHGKLKEKEELAEKEQAVYDLVREWFIHKNIVDKYWRDGIRTPKAEQRIKEMEKQYEEMERRYSSYRGESYEDISMGNKVLQKVKMVKKNKENRENKIVSLSNDKMPVFE